MRWSGLLSTHHWRGNTLKEWLRGISACRDKLSPTEPYKLSTTIIGFAGSTTDQTLAQQLLQVHFWTQAQPSEQQPLTDLPHWQKEAIKPRKYTLKNHVWSCWIVLLKKWFKKNCQSQPQCWTRRPGICMEENKKIVPGCLCLALKGKTEVQVAGMRSHPLLSSKRVWCEDRKTCRRCMDGTELYPVLTGRGKSPNILQHNRKVRI